MFNHDNLLIGIFNFGGHQMVYEVWPLGLAPREGNLFLFFLQPHAKCLYYILTLGTAIAALHVDSAPQVLFKFVITVSTKQWLTLC